MLIQSAYQSQITADFTAQTLLDTQKTATTYNVQHDITSCLYIDKTTVFHVLEGKIQNISHLMKQLQNNITHRKIEVLSVRGIQKRQFENWAFATFTPQDPHLCSILESLQLNTLTSLPVGPKINILKLASARKFWAFDRASFKKTLREVPTLSTISLDVAA